MADWIGRLIGNAASARFDVDDAAPTAVASTNGKALQRKSAPISFIPRDNQGNTIESPLFLTGRQGEATRLTAYTVAAYAYIAMRYRAEKVAEAPLMVVEETDDGEEWLEDHELAEFLDQPSPDYDMGELLYLTRIYRDMTGMAIWVKDEDRAGRVGRLTPFHGEEFEVRKTEERIYGEFRLTGRNEWMPAERVVFYREPHPGDWWRGLGWVEVALQTLNLGQAVTVTARNLLRNAIFPSLVVQAHPEWNPDDDEWEAWKAALDAHAAAENKGKLLALAGGGTATVVQAKISELLPGELLDRVEAVIAALSGIPAVVLQYHVGISNSPWSQMEEARRMAYEDAIETLWKKDERVLTRQLLRPADPDPNHYIRFDRSRIGALKADDSKRATVIAGVSRIWTVDEGRIYTGQEPINDHRLIAEVGQQDFSALFGSREPDAGEGGPDAPRPAVGESDTEATVDKDAALNGAQVTAAIEVLVRLRSENEAERISRIAAVELLVAVGISRDRATRMVAAAPDKGAKAEGKSDARFRASLSSMLQEEQGRSLLIVVADLLETDRDAVVRIANTRLAAKADGPTEAQRRAMMAAVRRYLEDESIEAWERAIRPIIEAMGVRAAEVLAAELGIGMNLLRPDVLAFAEREVAWLVKEIAATTRDAIADAIQAGIREGEGSQAIARRLNDLPAFDRDRARLVARTETTRVMNGAPTEALVKRQEETGRRYVKTWHAVLDDRTRDEHEAMHGETVPVDEPFSNGLDYPQEPNCRCVLLTSAVEGL